MSINIISDYFGEDDKNDNNNSEINKAEVTFNNNFNIPESEQLKNEIIIDTQENTLESNNDIKIIKTI